VDSLLNIFNNQALGSAAIIDKILPGYKDRIISRFHSTLISEIEGKKIEKWNEMNDNMFFVVYTFKE
jgi:hypothetical protein